MPAASPHRRGRPPTWDQARICAAIHMFVAEQGRVPGYRDFQDALYGLPPRATVERYWRLWQEAVQAAGYEPPPTHRGRRLGTGLTTT